MHIITCLNNFQNHMPEKPIIVFRHVKQHTLVFLIWQTLSAVPEIQQRINFQHKSTRPAYHKWGHQFATSKINLCEFRMPYSQWNIPSYLGCINLVWNLPSWFVLKFWPCQYQAYNHSDALQHISKKIWGYF